jgi:hypothetical protein
MVDQIWVSFLANFRTSVSDLQPPTYDYWGERYGLDLPSGDRSHKNMAIAYIISIWVVWFL